MKDARQSAAQQPVNLGPMSDSLGFMLRLAQLETFKDFYRFFGEKGIRPGEISVLILIGKNPGIRQGTLATQLMIKRAHMTKMMQAFESSGLVERSVPAGDKRGIELRLTEPGERHLEALMPIFSSHEDTHGERLSQSEMAQMKHLLRKFLNIPEEGEAK